MNERYNKYLKQIISLNEGERFCPNCDGAGAVKCSWKKNNFVKGSTLLQCHICLGEGKIDWVEEAVGKRAINQNAET